VFLEVIDERYRTVASYIKQIISHYFNIDLDWVLTTAGTAAGSAAAGSAAAGSAAARSAAF